MSRSRILPLCGLETERQSSRTAPGSMSQLLRWEIRQTSPTDENTCPGLLAGPAEVVFLACHSYSSLFFIDPTTSVTFSLYLPPSLFLAQAASALTLRRLTASIPSA